MDARGKKLELTKQLSKQSPKVYFSEEEREIVFKIKVCVEELHLNKGTNYYSRLLGSVEG